MIIAIEMIYFDCSSSSLELIVASDYDFSKEMARTIIAVVIFVVAAASDIIGCFIFAIILVSSA